MYLTNYINSLISEGFQDPHFLWVVKQARTKYICKMNLGVLLTVPFLTYIILHQQESATPVTSRNLYNYKYEA